MLYTLWEENDNIILMFYVYIIDYLRFIACLPTTLVYNILSIYIILLEFDEYYIITS